MNKMYESLKPVVALPQTTVDAAANQDTEKFILSEFRRALFVVSIEAAAKNAFQEGEVITLTLKEGKGLAGTTQDLVEDIDITGGVGATKAYLFTEDHAIGDDVTVNGVQFDRTDDGYDAGDRPLEWNTRDQLVTAINAADLGITATDHATHGVDLAIDAPGTMTIDVEEDIVDAKAYAATLQAEAIVEAYGPEFSDLDHTAVFINIDNDKTASGNIEVFAVVLLGLPYHSPVKQHVAVVK